MQHAKETVTELALLFDSCDRNVEAFYKRVNALGIDAKFVESLSASAAVVAPSETKEAKTKGKKSKTKRAVRGKIDGNVTFIFNYKDTASKTSRLVNECRNLVVRFPRRQDGESPQGQVLSRSFSRFFNHTEEPKDGLNAIVKAFESKSGSVVAMEKLDGSLVSMSFIDGAWFTFTRANDANSPGSKSEYGDRISALVKGREMDPSVIYVLELCIPGAQVTRYKETRLVLLALFDRTTGAEMDFAKSTKITDGWDLPKVVPVSSFDEAEALLTAPGTPSDFEGYVLHDQSSGARVKLKSQAYLRLRHFGDWSNPPTPDVVRKVIEGEAAEVISAFPHLEDLVKAIEAAEKHTLEVLKSHLEFRDACRANNKTRDEFLALLPLKAMASWIWDSKQRDLETAKRNVYGEWRDKFVVCIVSQLPKDVSK